MTNRSAPEAEGFAEDVAEVARLRDEVSRWRSQTVTRWSTAVAAESELERLLTEFHRLEAAVTADREAWNAEVHRLRKDLDLLQGELHHMRIQRDDLAAKLADAETRIADMQRSSSWRLTRPLRSVGGLARRVRGL